MNYQLSINLLLTDEPLTAEERQALKEIFAVTGHLDHILPFKALRNHQLAALPEFDRKGYMLLTQWNYMILKLPKDLT